MRGFFGGFGTALVAIVLLVFAAVETGTVPARADRGPMPGEEWAANTSLHATLRREAPKPPYPFSPAGDADIANGAKLYVQHCAVCHGTAHGTATSIARGLAVRAPQFARHGVDDDPEGVTYWKIEHGINMTGMPAFDKSLDEKSIWQIAYFLKRKPEQLPAAAKAIWEHPQSVPSAPPLPPEKHAAKGTGEANTAPR